MNDVRLLRAMGDDQMDNLKENLPQYCRSGVMFADLINRIAGREDVIKGINRNPQNSIKSVSQMQANFIKVMGYFKEFPKFCPRYLWS